MRTSPCTHSGIIVIPSPVVEPFLVVACPLQWPLFTAVLNMYIWVPLLPPLASFKFTASFMCGYSACWGLITRRRVPTAMFCHCVRGRCRGSPAFYIHLLQDSAHNFKLWLIRREAGTPPRRRCLVTSDSSLPADKLHSAGQLGRVRTKILHCFHTCQKAATQANYNLVLWWVNTQTVTC